MATPIHRCAWAETNELFLPYHDDEWGTPQHDDRYLFEMLTLEGAQAGLSWLTILKRREGYRQAFDNFDVDSIARYSDDRLITLMNNPEIIRNKLKIMSVAKNARAYQKIQHTHGSFDSYIWGFVDDAPLPYAQRQTAIEISVTMSKQLKKDGFTFVGPTICFALMQATGMINDHEPRCYLYAIQPDERKTLPSHA